MHTTAFAQYLCLVVAETVVGATTGVVPPPKGYFKAMKSVCDKYGALLILDEVMSGMGSELLPLYDLKTDLDLVPYRTWHSSCMGEFR